MLSTTTLKFKKLTSIFLLSCTLLLTSCGGEDNPANPEIPGVSGPHLTLNEDNLLISAVFEDLTLQGGLRFAIPEYNDSYVEISPNLEGGVLMAVNISLQDVFDNAGLLELDEQTLPGGRNLPGVATGTLPAVAFSIPQFNNMSIYLGENFFGVFFPINTGIENQILTFRYHVGDRAVGNVSIVGSDENGENAGFLLLLSLTETIEGQANRLIRRYN